MLRRHQIFNVIIAYWMMSGKNSTPRRGELLRLLDAQGMPMSRQNLIQHLIGLEKDGFLSVEDSVIILRREEPVGDIVPVTCHELKSMQG